MATAPKSPRGPSRVPRTPSTPTQLRTPKRVVPPPKRAMSEAKRVKNPQQPESSNLTPKRANPTKPRRANPATPPSILRKPSQNNAKPRIPKRAAEAEAGRGVVKKRIVGELAARSTKPKPSPAPLVTRSKSFSKSKADTETPKSIQRSKSGVTLHGRRAGPDSKQSQSPEKLDKDKSAASSKSNKRHQKVKFATDSMSSQKNREEKESSARYKKRAVPQPAKVPQGEDEIIPEQDGEKQQAQKLIPEEPKGNAKKKKRPTAGRYDLRLPEADNGETVNDEVSPQISAKEHGKKQQTGLDSSEQFVPLDPSAEGETQHDSATSLRLETAKKKEARKMKWKARKLRMRGELPESEEGMKKMGVLYLGHIPHGFYEKEMRAYFSQFGDVTRVRLSRSKKTARSRGYAFLEFADAQIASIAGEAMDGYLMHGQALVAKVVPDNEVHPDTFKGANRTFRKVPWSAVERRQMIARAEDPLKLAARSKRVQKSSKNKLKSLAKRGIKYEYPEISS